APRAFGAPVDRIEVRFDYTLKDKAPAGGGYIVQKITLSRAGSLWGGKAGDPVALPQKPTKVYWEAWFVKEGDKVHEDHAKLGYTDGSSTQIGLLGDGSWGVTLSEGEIRFFTFAVTGDIGHLNQDPPKPVGGW